MRQKLSKVPSPCAEVNIIFLFASVFVFDYMSEEEVQMRENEKDEGENTGEQGNAFGQ